MSKTKKSRLPAIIQHGWCVLPHVIVDAYNEELKDDEGFLGDRASKGAFRTILNNWRKEVTRGGEDPFGGTPTWQITKSQLDKYLAGDDAVAAGLVHTAVEEFACELAAVTARFLRLDEWKDTEHIVVGGGLSGSHIGRLAQVPALAKPVDAAAVSQILGRLLPLRTIGRNQRQRSTPSHREPKPDGR